MYFRFVDDVMFSHNGLYGASWIGYSQRRERNRQNQSIDSNQIMLSDKEQQV